MQMLWVLGTDYNILMIARLREQAREGMNPHNAAAHAIRQSGPRGNRP
jgi:RND superfamily putative drug exporter